MFRFLKYLRITWTVFCGIACVLLIVLWVRSYHHVDVVRNKRILVEERKGVRPLFVGRCLRGERISSQHCRPNTLNASPAKFTYGQT